MTERKEKAYTHRIAALFGDFADRVVDGGDVVDIKSVPHTERVGDKRQSPELRIAGGTAYEQR